MRLLLYLFPTILFFSLTNCNDEKDNTIPTNGVTYRVGVTFNWTTSNHTSNQGDFPKNAHFSPVIGAVHKNNNSFFRTADLASPGVRLMAETGEISILSSEIDLHISQGTIYDKFFAERSASNEENVYLPDIKAYNDFHFLSLVSMIAPSPDWFIAARNINLKNEDGTWKNQVIIDMHGYDSGTDSGKEFTSPNHPTSPVDEITRFNGNDDIIFATLTLTRL